MGSEEARVVRDWIESGDRVRRILAANGSQVIKKACDSISLRELGVMAKALGHGIYSATFIKPDLVEASNDE